MVLCANILGFCIGTIIYVETFRARGHWMDAHDSHYAYFTGATQVYVVTQPDNADPWAKWILRDGGGGNVMLESLRYRDHYLDAHHSHYVYVTHSNYPYDQSWAKWKLTKDGHNNYYFESARYGGHYLESYSGWYVYYGYLHKGKANSAKMRVYQPQIEEDEKKIFSWNNIEGPEAVPKQITETIGISSTVSLTQSATVGVDIGLEIKEVLTIGGSASASWEQAFSTTWSSSTTDQTNYIIPAGKAMSFWQSYADYGTDDDVHGPYYRVCRNSFRSQDDTNEYK